jgi:hypothetical protein
MADLHTKIWRLYEDPELRVVHSSSACPAAKIAVKYGYLKSIAIQTPDEAATLDRRARPCDRCVARELAAAKSHKRGYLPPPGFRGVIKP